MKADRAPNSTPVEMGQRGRSRYIAETAAALPPQTPRKPAPIKGIREIIDTETGEVFQVSRTHDCTLVIEQTPSQKRAHKWMRKAALVEIFGRKHRVACCHRNPVKEATDIQVWAKLGAYLPGHYVGLQTCALPWLCPICSPKIAERRANEIQQAMGQCLAQGGQVLMPTFTIPHGRQDPLSDTLRLIKDALRWMVSHRQYKQLQSRLGVQGRIIATEINHGEANGWHPHFHELWFFEGSGVDAAQLEKDLHVLWVAACHKFGLGTPSRKHGVVVQDGSRAASYVAKMGDKPWTLADEMAKANAKKGRRSNRSFWQLIDCYMDENATTQHRNRAKQLIREYAEATKGRKVLTWTQGLKKRYAVTDMTDEELAAQQEEEAVFIADIPLPDWRIVIRHRLEAVILDVCLNGRQAVYAIIEAYRTKAPPNKRHCDEKG
ncbi:protein rep (plasmid) [Aeromonas sp. 19NY04SH05-1]|uniref:Protein rep n=2 Tax=Aeromonas TaxID=642 RepID=A0AAU6TEQ1_9GAMM